MGSESKTNNNPLAKKYDEDESWTDFIWNGRTGQFFGRTGLSWFNIFIFYVIFYICLGAFAWFCYYLFAMTLEDSRPKWILDSSIIGTNPGIGFRPLPDQDSNAGSSLIWYKRRGEDEAFWYKQLERYVNDIKNGNDNGVQCSVDNKKQSSNAVVCAVDTQNLRGCTKETKFGYPAGRPCILIKLNRIFGWKPEPFGLRNGKFDRGLLNRDLEGNQVPKWLKSYIWDIVNKRDKVEERLNTVWVSCDGEQIVDMEDVGSGNSTTYDPIPGIPGYYFPYLNQKGYQSPFVMVQFNKPVLHTLMNIECRAWARNIAYDKLNRLGSVHLELLID